MSAMCFFCGWTMPSAWAGRTGSDAGGTITTGLACGMASGKGMLIFFLCWLGKCPASFRKKGNATHLRGWMNYEPNMLNKTGYIIILISWFLCIKSSPTWKLLTFKIYQRRHQIALKRAGHFHNLLNRLKICKVHFLIINDIGIFKDKIQT